PGGGGGRRRWEKRGPRRSNGAGAAASLAPPPPMTPRANKLNAATRTTQPAARCESTSAALTPPIAASAAKPPTRISDTRFEMVMVRRSLEAANAIIAGNSVSLRASATMIMSWREPLLECVLDEGRTELRAQPLHHGNDRDRDAGSDEAVLDGGRPRHVLHEALHE